jgi:acetyl/propionyl-CoA carboxylase alpha subunit
VRVDAGVMEGGEVTVYYDPMIAKVIATAESRPLAISRLAAALRAFEIGGIRTNLSFLVRILELDEFRSGTIDTEFLDRESARLVHPSAVPSPQSPIPNPQSLNAPAAFDPWNGAASRFAASTPSAKARARRRGAAEESLTAPMPASVIKVNAKPGDSVRKGDVVVLLEAMKMELPLRAASDATVAAVHCREGELVQGEAVLVEFEKSEIGR